MPPRYKLWLEDGQTTTGEPPADCGIVCIAQYRQDGQREVLRGSNWYYWHDGDGCWWNSDLFGLLRHLTRDAPIRWVREGALIGTLEYDRTILRAMQDPDMPKE